MRREGCWYAAPVHEDLMIVIARSLNGIEDKSDSDVGGVRYVRLLVVSSMNFLAGSSRGQLSAAISSVNASSHAA